MRTVAFLLKPLDVLFFRDARPFNLTDYGQSQLPTPQTLVGMIKTHLMRHVGQGPAWWHGGHDLPAEQRPWQARLGFRGPWLCREKAGRPDLLFPAPADLMRAGKEDRAPLIRLRPLDPPPPGWTSHPEGLLPLWHYGSQRLRRVNGCLDTAGMAQYLAGCCPDRDAVHPFDDFRGWEDRTGVGIRPDTLTAEEGRIYSVRFLRLMQGISFYAELALPDGAPLQQELFPEGLHLPWGGEGRRVLVETVEPFDWSQLNAELDERFVTVLITPGIFSNRTHPWKPIDQGRLISAAVPKPQAVSGWDLAGVRENGHAPRPRPTRFAVPAGGVFFWQRGNHHEDKPVRTLNGLCDRPADRDSGWGLALRGSWEHCKPPHKEQAHV